MITEDIKRDTLYLTFILSFTIFPTFVFEGVVIFEGIKECSDYLLPFHISVFIYIFIDIFILCLFIVLSHRFTTIEYLRLYMNYLLDFHFLYCIIPTCLCLSQIIVTFCPNDTLYGFAIFFLMYNTCMLFVRIILSHYKKPYWLCF